MTPIKLRFAVGLSLIVACCVFAIPSWAGQTDSVTFQTSGQSIWSSGPAFTYSYSASISAGAGFDTGQIGPGVGCDPIFGDCYGGYAELSGSASAGLGLNFSVGSGAANSTIPVQIGLGYPTLVAPATPFSVTSSALFGSGSLNTTSPYLAASANLFGSASLNVSGKACFIGCVSGSTGISGGGTVNLFSFDTRTQPSASIGLGYGVSLNVTAPSIGASGTGGNIINANGSSPFLGLNADITDLATGLLGLPSTHGSFGVSGLLTVNYNLIDIVDALNLGITQGFSLNSNVMVRYHVVDVGSAPRDFFTPTFSVGTPVNFAIPAGDQHAFITPIYTINASLLNNTGLSLSDCLNVTGLGGDINILSVADPGFGPLINASQCWPIGSLSVFDSTFGLGGWNVAQGATFEVTATPEPTSLLLLGTGILAAASGFRRPRRKS